MTTQSSRTTTPDERATSEPSMDVETSAGRKHDPAAEKKVVRLLDWNIMPQLFVIFTLASLDRSNIGNARAAGLGRELLGEGPEGDSSQYEWLLTIFYIAYIVFEFTIVLFKVFPPHMVVAVQSFIWGLASTLQAAAYNWSGLMTCRFFLGAAESTTGPGLTYYLSFFYLRREIGFRAGIFTSAAPLASTFAGALAHFSMASSFLVEGLPPIIVASFLWFFLPDGPPQARFLNAEQKRIAASRNLRQAGQENRVGGFKPMEALQALADIKPWITALMYFSMNVSYSSLPVYLPTLLTYLGFSSVTAQGLTAPPYVFAFLITLLTTWTADRMQQRGLHTFVLSCVGGTGYILLATVSSIWVRYFAVFLTAGGIYPAIANTVPWVLNNQGSDSGRGMAIMVLNMVGQTGPLLGTRLYPNSEASRFAKGHAVCAAFLFFNALLALGLRTLLLWENKKLDRRYGSVEEIKEETREREGPSGENQETEDVGVENDGPMYRYVL